MWRRVGSTTLLNHPRLTVAEDQVVLPGGRTVPWLRFAGQAEGVSVMCVQQGRLLVQEQYSYPPDQILLELPGGAVEPGETLEAAARRELVEECGLLAGPLTPLGGYYLNNRRSNARMFVFTCTHTTPCDRSGGDLEEQPHPVWIPLEEVPAMIAAGVITNQGLLASWALWLSQPTTTTIPAVSRGRESER
jgi:ADP-ribose pyrophosphatase